MEDELNLMDELNRMEAQSKFEFDNVDEDVSDIEVPEWIPETLSQREVVEEPVVGLGKIRRDTFDKDPIGLEKEWKNISPENLPSRGFGYPDGFELAIKHADVSEIRHYSTIDETDRIDLDDKLNNILAKCMKIKWDGGFLDPLDLWYEDRFFIIMSIRDLTFIRGENRIMLPVTKNCTKPECNIADQIELKANLLDSFVMEPELLKRYDRETFAFKMVPKDGSEEIDLFIPTVGVTTTCRKILRDKAKKGKKYDESFAEVCTFIISDWRNLNESLYDQYERSSKDWSNLQFSIADQVSKKISFATKSRIFQTCNSCGGEVTAQITFPGGYRSLFVISDIFSQLL